MEAVTTSPETVLYLYGFVRAGFDRGALAAAGEGVFLVETDGVACAARTVAAVDYHIPPDTSTAAQQLEWVAPRAWQHHEVVRHVHAATAVVPLKFGTLCPDAGHAGATLRRLRIPILEMLETFEGKDEWTVNVSADVELLSAALQHAQPGLAALLADVERLPEGRAYFARKKLQQARAEAVAARLSLVERNVLERFAAGGIAAAASEPPHGAETRALAAVPILVARRRFTELEGMLADLESEHADAHVTFELVGPWPPYSFAAGLELKEPL